VDLWRADAKWVYYYDFKQLYATNPMFETIRQQRLDNRVAFAMSQPRSQDEAGMMNILHGAYQQFWLHKAFPYHAILSLDISQMPRALQDYDRFMRGTNAALPISSPTAWPRLWEMTSTRWLFGLASAPDYLNQLDGGKGRFKLQTAFAYQPKPGVSQPRSVEDLDYVPQPGAPMGLIEFTGALPRAKLYSRWQVETNDDAALKVIASPGFNPQETVIVNDPIPASTPMAAPDAGTATIVTNVYKPTRLVVDATVKTPAVLLVTDKAHEYWSVKVDGAPAKMLRCNYMMRGVRLEPGAHKVEFVLQPPIRSQWLNLAGIAATLAMVGYLMWSKPRA